MEPAAPKAPADALSPNSTWRALQSMHRAGAGAHVSWGLRAVECSGRMYRSLNMLAASVLGCIFRRYEGVLFIAGKVALVITRSPYFR